MSPLPTLPRRQFLARTAQFSLGLAALSVPGRLAAQPAVAGANDRVRLAVCGVARGVACEGCQPLPTLLSRYAAAGGSMLVCGICVDAKGLDPSTFVDNATKGGTVQLWQWIGDDSCTTFSY